MLEHTRDRLKPIAIAAMLFVQTILLGWNAWQHSPVMLEVGHLPAGISHWRFGSFALYQVNPPLVRMVAAMAVMPARPNTDWSRFSTGTGVRSETAVGIDFVNANRDRIFWLYTLGRLACIPFCWVGAWICYRWAGELYGTPSNLLAMALWCFCPNILGHGPLIMPDVPAAALAAVSCYAFWRWLKSPNVATAVVAGFALGLAESTKTTLIIFYPLWPMLWIAYRCFSRHHLLVRTWLREAGHLGVIALVSVFIVNSVCGFEGSFEPLRNYRFQSQALTGLTANGAELLVGNRFSQSLLGSLPVPLPRHYLLGIDMQRVDFERGMPSYLRGQWSEQGWWYFYVYALAIKVPLGTWLLVALAVANCVLMRRRAIAWREEMTVLVPPAAILLVVSSQTGFTVHFRYVILILPFLFIWASSCVSTIGLGAAEHRFGTTPQIGALPRRRDYRRSLGSRSAVMLIIAAGALGWSISSSLWSFPHSLSYFNELTGGPQNGHNHLLDSNVAWGQDLLHLKRWYDEHSRARPLYVAAFGVVNPKYAGIEFNLPRMIVAEGASSATAPRPGWYAIDVNYLHGGDHEVIDEHGEFHPTSEPGLNYECFQRLQPVDRVGFSLQIFHVGPDANDARARELTR